MLSFFNVNYIHEMLTSFMKFQLKTWNDNFNKNLLPLFFFSLLVALTWRCVLLLLLSLLLLAPLFGTDYWNIPLSEGRFVTALPVRHCCPIAPTTTTTTTTSCCGEDDFFSYAFFFLSHSAHQRSSSEWSSSGPHCDKSTAALFFFATADGQ